MTPLFGTLETVAVGGRTDDDFLVLDLGQGGSATQDINIGHHRNTIGRTAEVDPERLIAVVVFARQQCASTDE